MSELALACVERYVGEGEAYDTRAHDSVRAMGQHACAGGRTKGLAG
jgi:hypothetical protein